MSLLVCVKMIKLLFEKTSINLSQTTEEAVIAEHFRRSPSTWLPRNPRRFL
jgi:hypothetical protein